MEPEKEQSRFLFNTEPSVLANSPGVTVSSEGKHILLPAASMVSVSLPSDVVVRRGRTTVIAIVGKKQNLPVGTKLLGQASASPDGLVSIRFDAIVLPNGTSVKARAEALDAKTNSPDLFAAVSGGPAPKEKTSVARSVGEGTASRLASTLLGGGIAGGAARDALSGSRRSHSTPRGSARVVTLSRDTPLKALFLQEVVMKNLVDQ